jgi:uncharacterized membrane protein YkoI
MRFASLMATAAGLVLITLAIGVRGDESKISFDQVPKPVVDAIKAKFPGARPKAAVKEVEDGKTLFEITIIYQGKSIDVVAKPDGTITAIEKLIDAKDLPKPVTATLNSKYPGATVKKAEELTEDGKVSYEVSLTTADKKTVGVTLDPQGKILETEGADADKGKS